MSLYIIYKIMDNYFDTNFGYWGKNKMMRKLRDKMISSRERERIRRNLGNIYALQRHRQVNASMLKRHHRRISAPHPFASVQTDLAFLPNLRSPINNNVIGFIIFIDVFSRYMWIKTLTNRKELHNKVNEMFNEMNREFGKIPENLTADNEFATNELQRLVARRLKGRLWLAEPHEKFRTGIVERAIRTMKDLIKRYLTQNNTTKYINILPNLVSNYNNTYHDFIRTKPIYAIKTGQTYPKPFDKKIKSLRIGDKVRILDPRKRGWTKGDVPYYTKDIYTIVGFDRNRYRVRNESNPADPRNKRAWAIHQLQKIKNVIKTTDNSNTEPPEDPYDTKVRQAQGYDEGISLNKRRNSHQRYLKSQGLDLENIIGKKDRDEAMRLAGGDDINEDDEKAEILKPKEVPKETRIKQLTAQLKLLQNGRIRHPIEEKRLKDKIQKLKSIQKPPARRGVRMRKKVVRKEIRPVPRPVPRRKTKPETLSDFEREEKKVKGLIDKYGMQGKFHLQAKTRERMKKLLNAKKKFLANKKFVLPKSLPPIKEGEEFRPPELSSSDDVSEHSSDDDIIREMEFERQIKEAKRKKQYKRARHIQKRYNKWKRNKK